MVADVLLVGVVLLLVVPSPLQVNCRVESWPGIVIDLAVDGGLQKANTHREFNKMHTAI